MKEISASEAARRFSAVLDGAEDGETYVITRAGRRVAMIVPAPRANGRAVSDVLGRWRDRLVVDDGFRRSGRGGRCRHDRARRRPVARLILDTGVLVAAVRGRLDPSAYAEEDDVALPAVVLADYLTGVELDDDPARQAAQRAFLDELLAVAPVVDYTHAVAVHHAALLAHVRREGRPMGAHDLIIAATARASGRLLVSTDRRAGFADLPDVDVRILDV